MGRPLAGLPVAFGAAAPCRAEMVAAAAERGRSERSGECLGAGRAVAARGKAPHGLPCGSQRRHPQRGLQRLREGVSLGDGSVPPHSFWYGRQRQAGLQLSGGCLREGRRVGTGPVLDEGAS